MSPHARVCIGVPVYNGEAYLAATLEAVLAQTHSDLDVVVADNASTDGSGGIARKYAEADRRVRYVRFEEHVGVADSYTRTFSLCHSEYFKWQASDDVVAPTFVAKAAAALDEHPTAVASYTEAAVVDSEGHLVRRDPYMLDLASPFPSTRLRRLMLAPPKFHAAHELYGVLRSRALRRTGVMSTHVYGDRVLLAQLTLIGEFLRIPEVLFFNRDHGGRSQREGRVKQRPGSVLSRSLGVGPWPPSEFWDPRKKGRIVFPEWDLAWQYVEAIRAANLPASEKAKCLAAVAELYALRSPKFARDIVIAAEQAARLAAAARAPWRGGLDELPATSRTAS